MTQNLVTLQHCANNLFLMDHYNAVMTETHAQTLSLWFGLVRDMLNGYRAGHSTSRNTLRWFYNDFRWSHMGRQLWYHIKNTGIKTRWELTWLHALSTLYYWLLLCLTGVFVYKRSASASRVNILELNPVRSKLCMQSQGRLSEMVNLPGMSYHNKINIAWLDLSLCCKF